MRTTAFKDFRREFTDSRFFLGRNRVMQLALGRSEQEEVAEHAHLLAAELKGHRGLFFTNREPEEVLQAFSSSERQEFGETFLGEYEWLRGIRDRRIRSWAIAAVFGRAIGSTAAAWAGVRGQEGTGMTMGKRMEGVRGVSKQHDRTGLSHGGQDDLQARADAFAGERQGAGASGHQVRHLPRSTRVPMESWKLRDAGMNETCTINPCLLCLHDASEDGAGSALSFLSLPLFVLATRLAVPFVLTDGSLCPSYCIIKEIQRSCGL
eukprot:scaffold2191_cov254-Pinguiococcus_pyrenoidosus.AAC.11